MKPADDASPSEPKGELRVVGTSVSREVELLLDRVAGMVKTEVEKLCRNFPLYPERQA